MNIRLSGRSELALPVCALAYRSDLTFENASESHGQVDSFSVSSRSSTATGQ